MHKKGGTWTAARVALVSASSSSSSLLHEAKSSKMLNSANENLIPVFFWQKYEIVLTCGRN